MLEELGFIPKIVAGASRQGDRSFLIARAIQSMNKASNALFTCCATAGFIRLLGLPIPPAANSLQQ